MVFNGVMVATVAKLSAEAWQYLACFPEHISGDQLVDLVICFPLQQFGRFALCVWSSFCVPPSPSTYYSYSYHHQDSDDDSDDDSYSSVYPHSYYDSGSHSD